MVMYKMSNETNDILKKLAGPEYSQLVSALKPFLDESGNKAAENVIGILNLAKIYQILSAQFEGNIAEIWKNRRKNFLETMSKIDPKQVEQFLKLLTILKTGVMNQDEENKKEDSGKAENLRENDEGRGERKHS